MDIFNIAGSIHSTSSEHVVAPASEISVAAHAASGLEAGKLQEILLALKDNISNPILGGSVVTIANNKIAKRNGTDLVTPADLPTGTTLTDGEYIELDVQGANDIYIAAEALVGGINDLIPTEATASNKLADKAYVGEQINAATSGLAQSATTLAGYGITDGASKVSGAVNGNFAGLDSNGNLTDSGKKASDFILSSEKGNSVATLVDGKVPGDQLPSFVDEIIEGYLDNDHFYQEAAHTNLVVDHNNVSADQLASKIYVDISTDKSYRWGTTKYVEINTLQGKIDGLSTGTFSGHIVTWGANGYTVADGGVAVEKSVPADAKFTDTTYTFSLVGDSLKVAVDGGSSTEVFSVGTKVDKSTTINSHQLTNDVVLTKSDISLGNVTNDAQVKRSEMGTASGVATLDSNSKVPANLIIRSGSTRPTLTINDKGYQFFDTNVSKPIWWDGSLWIEDLTELSDATILDKKANPYTDLVPDVVITNQQEYNNISTLVEAVNKSTVNVLIKEGIYVNNNQVPSTITATNSQTTINVYGENATVMGHTDEYTPYYSNSELSWFDITDSVEDVLNQNNIGAYITARFVLMDLNNKYVPYDYLSFYPKIISTAANTKFNGYGVEKVSAGTARLLIPDELSELKNKDADYFKYSYIRVASTWNDNKGYNLRSNVEGYTDYLYFDYYNTAMTDDTFINNYCNYKNMSPCVRLYNYNNTNGAILVKNGNKYIVKVSNTVNKLKVCSSSYIFNFKDYTNISVNGLKLIGTSPYTNGVFADESTSAIYYTGNSHPNVSINKCDIDVVLGTVLHGNNAFNNVTINKCNITVFQSIILEYLYNAESLFTFSNNRVEGSIDSFRSKNFIGIHQGSVSIADNTFKNIVYNAISVASFAYYGVRGEISHNEIYNEDKFLASCPFMLNDGGGIYVVNRNRKHVLLIQDNVVHNLPNLCGIYMDYGCSHIDVIGNLIYDCWPLNIHTNPNSILLTLNYKEDNNGDYISDGNNGYEIDNYNQNSDLRYRYNIFNGRVRLFSGSFYTHGVTDLSSKIYNLTPDPKDDQNTEGSGNEFVGNIYFGDKDIKYIMEERSYPANFDIISDNSKAHGFVEGDTVYIKNLLRPYYGKLVSSRIGEHEVYEEKSLYGNRIGLSKCSGIYTDYNSITNPVNAVAIASIEQGVIYLTLVRNYYKITVFNTSGNTPQHKLFVECLYDSNQRALQKYLPESDAERFFYYNGKVYFKVLLPYSYNGGATSYSQLSLLDDEFNIITTGEAVIKAENIEYQIYSSDIDHYESAVLHHYENSTGKVVNENADGAIAIYAPSGNEVSENTENAIAVYESTPNPDIVYATVIHGSGQGSSTAYNIGSFGEYNGGTIFNDSNVSASDRYTNLALTKCDSGIVYVKVSSNKLFKITVFNNIAKPYKKDDNTNELSYMSYQPYMKIECLSGDHYTWGSDNANYIDTFVYKNGILYMIFNSARLIFIENNDIVIITPGEILMLPKKESVISDGKVKDISYYELSPKKYGSTAERPNAMITNFTGSSLPTNINQLYDGFTFYDTSNSTYKIARINNSTLSWVDESTIKSNIPNNIIRKGVSQSRPTAKQVFEYLYEGFEYFDTTLNYPIYVKSISRDTTTSPYSYTVEWAPREFYNNNIVTVADKGMLYYDTTIDNLLVWNGSEWNALALVQNTSTIDKYYVNGLFVNLSSVATDIVSIDYGTTYVKFTDQYLHSNIYKIEVNRIYSGNAQMVVTQEVSEIVDGNNNPKDYGVQFSYSNGIISVSVTTDTYFSSGQFSINTLGTIIFNQN